MHASCKVTYICNAYDKSLKKLCPIQVIVIKNIPPNLFDVRSRFANSALVLEIKACFNLTVVFCFVWESLELEKEACFFLHNLQYKSHLQMHMRSQSKKSHLQIHMRSQ